VLTPPSPPTELWYLVLCPRYHWGYRLLVVLRHGKYPLENRLYSSSLIGHRLVAGQLSWYGAGSSSVGSFPWHFRVTQSLYIKKAFFTLLVGLSTAGMSPVYSEMYRVSDSAPEICSAYPTCGGGYFWAAMLSKPRGAPFAAWITGWISLVGHVAVTTALRFIIPSSVMRKSSADWCFMASSSFACANFISIAATLRTNYHPNSHKTIGIYAAVLFLQGMNPCDHSLIPGQRRCRYYQHIWLACS